MVFPETPVTLFHVTQVIFGIRIQPFFRVAFNNFALDFQTFLADFHQVLQALEEILFRCGFISQAGQVDRDHTYRSGQRVRCKQTAAPFHEFPFIQTKATTHTAHVIRLHVRIYEIGEIRNTVFCCHFPDALVLRVIPVKVRGNIVRRDGEREQAAGSIPFAHHFGERFVKYRHFGLEIPVHLFFDFTPVHDMFVFQEIGYDEIHRDIGKRCLESYTGGYVQVEQEFLQALFHLFVVQLVKAYVGGEERVEVRKSLCPSGLALHGIEEIHDLSESRAKVLCRAALRFPLHSPESDGK